MVFCRNKKSSLVSEKIVWIVLLTFSFILILPVIELFQAKASAKTAESICRGSVALREKTYTELRKGPLNVGSVGTPLLCRTIDKYAPEDKDATKEQVEEEIADLMTNCWANFLEGRIKDPFKEGDFIEKNCFVCYTLSVRKTPKFDGTITSPEILKYLFEHPYKSYPEGDFCKITGGFCEDAESSTECRNNINAPLTYLSLDKDNIACKKKSKEGENKKGCCYTDYGCWNKGGTCNTQNPDTSKYTLYEDDSWDCPKNMKCYIKTENYYSYGDYIQKFGGPGNIIALTDIKPGQTYAISFGAPTGKCDVCSKIGNALGIGTAGYLAISIGTGPAGWIIGGIAGAAGYVTIRSSAEIIGDIGADISHFFKRDISTIYLTTLDQARSGNYCNVIQDVREE